MYFHKTHNFKLQATNEGRRMFDRAFTILGISPFGELEPEVVKDVATKELSMAYNEHALGNDTVSSRYFEVFDAARLACYVARQVINDRNNLKVAS